MKLLENINVLVVEDQESIQKSICAIMNDLGADNVYSAGNGALALKVLKEKTVDLVISDWEMPTISGLRLLQTIRADKNLEKIKFIMLTGKTDKELVLSAIKYGVNDYIVKPIKEEILVEKIKKCLGDTGGT